MKTRPFNLFFSIVGVLVIGSLNSCTTPKDFVYFQNLKKDTSLHTLVSSNLDLKIRKNDLLGITIISPDPVSTLLFNNAQTAAGASGGGGSSASTNGFLVDNDGNIVMYKLGVIHVEGLTRNELKYKLLKDLAPYLKDAVVTVRFLSNHVTMLGEVAHPQVLSIPNEQIPLLDAIGESGDLTISGRRDNILVIRETPTGKLFKRINLTDNSIFNSAFYYLKPGDIVYIEPNAVKIKNSAQTQQTFGYLLSGLTILISLFTLLRR